MELIKKADKVEQTDGRTDRLVSAVKIELIVLNGSSDTFIVKD